MASQKKKVENARRFLWDDEEGGSGSGHTPRVPGAAPGTTGSRFSTRDFAVDQSVNLMAMGDQPLSQPSRGEEVGGGGFASSVAGLFRGSTGTEQSKAPHFDEYGDAAPSTESEEYISDKSRRVSPMWNSCVVCCGRLGFKGRMMLCMAILAIILLAGGLYVGFSGKVVLPSGREGKIREKIVAAGLTPLHVFQSGSSKSPQNMALKWIAYDDPAKLKLDDPALLDRYALAVFYYSSNGPTEGWLKMNNWMSGKGICIWTGVECEPIEQDETDGNNADPFKRSYDDNKPIMTLNLTENGIEGLIPGEFAKLPRFTTLDLSGNHLSGNIPAVLGTMTNARFILLRKNSFFGTIPTELGFLTQLFELQLGENQLTGTIPSEIGNLVGLRSLGLNQNLLMGPLPDLGRLNKLLRLYLDDNALAGPIRSWMGQLTSLKQLSLSKNKFTGTFPSIIKSMVNLEVLRMAENQFHGTIPNIFDHNLRLSQLELQHNKFMGIIPSSITHVQAMKKLFLDNNHLTGSIPGSIALLIDMEAFSVENNVLTGTIPSNLGYLDDVVHLSLNHNQLKGTIPTELGTMFRLESFRLDGNKLSGSVPIELGRLDRLTDLRMESNNLLGEMPMLVCSLVKDHNLKHLSSDCKSKIVCPCCSDCF